VKKKKIASRKATRSPQRSFDFDDLPPPLQSFFAEQVDRLREFRDRYPKLYNVMFNDVANTPEYRRCEEQIVSTQERHRKRGTR
jgi:hypothetical protein